MSTPPITIDISDHQSHPLPLDLLQHRWQHALQHIIQLPPGPLGSQLPQLQELQIALLDDPQISQVHGQFLDDPTPTDVITFHHGEILISTDTAARAAQQHHSSLIAETLLYGIHGIVHLHGYTDQSPEQKQQMDQIQYPLLQQLHPQ